MPYDEAPSRRRDQIIAKRSAAKARAEFYASGQSTPTLWRLVRDGLEDSRTLRESLGHSRKAIAVAQAEAALEEIILRGEQLRLPGR